MGVCLSFVLLFLCLCPLLHTIMVYLSSLAINMVLGMLFGLCFLHTVCWFHSHPCSSMTSSQNRLLLQANGLFRNPSALMISSYHNTLTCILQILGARFICCIVPCLHLCACLFILYPEGTSHALNLSIFTNTRVLSGKQSRWVWVTWGAFLITSLPRSLSCSLFSCLQSTRKLAS